jgi:hypothetical protein
VEVKEVELFLFLCELAEVEEQPVAVREGLEDCYIAAFQSLLNSVSHKDN